MRPLFLLPLFCLALSATEPLVVRLQKAHRLPGDQLAQLQVELAASGAPAEAKAYHEASLDYLQARRRQATDPKVDLALLDQAIKLLEPRKDADSRALLGACLDVKIGFAPMSGMTLSPKASALFDQARQQSPANPRVLLLQGVHLLFSPSFLGGGAEAALPLLTAAVKAAAAEALPTDDWAPSWGKAESLVWLAQAQRKAGQEDAAKASLRQALVLDPAYAHAQALLKAVP